MTAPVPAAGIVDKRRGDWMMTYSGRAFWPLDPRADEIDPLDIAHALSMLCRYGGHVRRFYSVAEHCVLMSHAVAPEHALWALLHDATEAYMVDLPRPINRILLDERAALLAKSELPWTSLDGLSPLGVDVVGLSPLDAEIAYLSRLGELCRVRSLSEGLGE